MPRITTTLVQNNTNLRLEHTARALEEAQMACSQMLRELIDDELVKDEGRSYAQDAIYAWENASEAFLAAVIDTSAAELNARLEMLATPTIVPAEGSH